ncbi:MAG: ExeA family protein [Phycisphaerae bacterium]
MYLDHWSLTLPPFEPAPDSRFLFLAPSGELALAAMSYVVGNGGGEPVLLCGEAGCGKTLLLRALRRQLPAEHCRVAFVPDMAAAQTSLLERVAYHLTRERPAGNGAAIAAITEALGEAERERRTVVLMLDDWPAAAPQTSYDELRWLLDCDISDTRPCVLMSSEDSHVVKEWPRWMRQRLFTVAAVEPLTEDQVPRYLAHRLRIAGGPAELFTPDAARRIAAWSGGVPRLINRVAHLALHVAYLDLARRIETGSVERAIARVAAREPRAAGAAATLGAEA